ncbi:hypothetical protein [uncultured Algimonas sp.]|nr:hypothetical protein [uncultured Algimonas sp.]
MPKLFRSYIDHVSRPRAILGYGAATIVLTLIFGFVMTIWDFRGRR